MAKICTKCGLPLKDDAVFCAGCGEAVETEEQFSQPLSAVPRTVEPIEDNMVRPAEPQPDPVIRTIEPAPDSPITGFDFRPAEKEKPEEKRVFHLRERKYGDTAQFDGEPEHPADHESYASIQTRINICIYLAVFASILSVIAIVMVILFSVLPQDSSAANADESGAEETVSSVLPTMEPTEPPIKGTFALVRIDSEKRNFYEMQLEESSLEMESDFTGKLVVKESFFPFFRINEEDKDLAFDTETKTVVFLKEVCPYEFDGKKITINFKEMTLVYEKQA